MIAKVIATAKTRDDALSLLTEALDKTVLSGPIHNIEFLSVLITLAFARKLPALIS